jgi:hypothetical protein
MRWPLVSIPSRVGSLPPLLKDTRQKLGAGQALSAVERGRMEIYAVCAATTTAWYWGGSEAECRYANGADLSAKAQGVTATRFVNCDDKYPETSPVGRFRANAFGFSIWQATSANGLRTATTRLTAVLPPMVTRSRPAWRNSTPCA